MIKLLKIIQTVFGLLILVAFPLGFMFLIQNRKEWALVSAICLFLSIAFVFALRRITEPHKAEKKDFLVIGSTLMVALAGVYFAINLFSTYEVYILPLWSNGSIFEAELHIPEDKVFENKLLKVELEVNYSTFQTQPTRIFLLSMSNGHQNQTSKIYLGPNSAKSRISTQTRTSYLNTSIEFLPVNGKYLFTLAPPEGNISKSPINSATIHLRAYR